LPCYKLAARFQRDDMIERFLSSGRSGFYFSVEQEGSVTAGDTFEVLSREPGGITIEEINSLYSKDRYNRALIEKALATPALPEESRTYYARRLMPSDAQS
jgi:MOSC domain-containing protein YiiM